MMKREWMDVSVPLQSGMVTWPGDPRIEIERVTRIEKGDVANVSLLSMGAHTGTHMDAPYHFLSSGKGIDLMPLDAVIGPARVIEVLDPVSVKPKDLQAHKIRRKERILLKTINSGRCWGRKSFVQDFVYISKEAATYLAARQVMAVGIDYLSVGGYRADGVETHHRLLKAGIWIIEGLDLRRVQPGRYDLLCLPLRIKKGDGAPARALLRPR